MPEGDCIAPAVAPPVLQTLLARSRAHEKHCRGELDWGFGLCGCQSHFVEGKPFRAVRRAIKQL